MQSLAPCIATDDTDQTEQAHRTPTREDIKPKAKMSASMGKLGGKATSDPSLNSSKQTAQVGGGSLASPPAPT